MKKIVIILAFIFVGMANAMQQWSLLDGNEVPQYVHTDPAKIAYLKDIQGLYHRIQREDVQSCTQEEIQSEGRTKGPGIEQLFSFLVPVQNHDVPHIKPFEGDFYLTEHENDEEEVFAPLILDCSQEASVKNAEKQQDRATVDRQEKELESMQSIFLGQIKEKSNPRKKRTLKEAIASDEKNRNLSKESVVLNASKRSMSSKNMEICGINGCQYRSAFNSDMKVHKRKPHKLIECPYPDCSAPYQSQDGLSQHIGDAHPEKYCKVCDYAPKKLGNLLRHFRGVEHLRKLASINSREGQIV